MKKYIFFLAALFLFSCEDKVDVPLDTAAPKLVIDANIFWEKGTTGNEQMIKLTTTTNYFATEIPTVSGALVQITNAANTVFNFVETVPNSGEYICTNFAPVVGDTYTLTVAYDGQVYTATEKLLATPDILSTEQKTVSVFGSDMIQVKYFYQDNGDEENYYLLKVKNQNLAIPEYGVQDDTFFQGNLMFGFYTAENDKLFAGTVLNMSVAGISKRYYNYMNKLINIAGNSQGPFSSPPVTLRGNIVNSTNETNYPLGYFHLSEISKINYTVE